MIPEFTSSNVLPPFIGDSPTTRADSSPYVVSMLEVVERFATSLERIKILEGFLQYREKLILLGFIEGYQWIDGSFVENVEVSRQRSPADIDIVTFSYWPRDAISDNWISSDEFIAIVTHSDNEDIFVPQVAKKVYGCDAYFVDLCQSGHNLVDITVYWFGLFSHTRESSLWKGILKIPLQSDDERAKELLEQIKSNYRGGESC